MSTVGHRRNIGQHAYLQIGRPNCFFQNSVTFHCPPGDNANDATTVPEIEIEETEENKMENEQQQHVRMEDG
jgi:hypothetical protein